MEQTVHFLSIDLDVDAEVQGEDISVLSLGPKALSGSGTPGTPPRQIVLETFQVKIALAWQLAAR